MHKNRHPPSPCDGPPPRSTGEGPNRADLRPRHGLCPWQALGRRPHRMPSGVEAVMAGVAATHDLWDNPMGTDGFEFVEYTGPDPAQLGALFERMGFVAAARHRSKNVTLYRQGGVNFIVNA